MDDMARLKKTRLDAIERSAYVQNDERVQMYIGEIDFLVRHARLAIEAASAPDEIEAALKAWFPTANWPEGTAPLLADYGRMGNALTAAAVWRQAREPKPAESEVDVAVNAFDAARCRLNVQWHGGTCPPMSEANKATIKPMFAEVITALDACRRARGDDVEALKARAAKAEAQIASRDAHLAALVAEASDLLKRDQEATERANKAESDRDALREQVERLRAALDPFASANDSGSYTDRYDISDTQAAEQIRFGDLRRARAALAATDPKE
jgi:hypothetical protein